MQNLLLLLRLDVLGDDAHVQRIGQLRDGGYDLTAVVMSEQSLDQRAVELDYVEGVLLQIVEGCLPHGKIIYGKHQTHGPKLTEGIQRSLIAVQRCLLGDLKAYVLAIERISFVLPTAKLYEARGYDRSSGDIDRQLGILPETLQDLRPVRKRLAQDSLL